jgi:hypothetical protein
VVDRFRDPCRSVGGRSSGQVDLMSGKLPLLLRLWVIGQIWRGLVVQTTLDDRGVTITFMNTKGFTERFKRGSR